MKAGFTKEEAKEIGTRMEALGRLYSQTMQGMVVLVWDAEGVRCSVGGENLCRDCVVVIRENLVLALDEVLERRSQCLCAREGAAAGGEA